MLIKILLFLLCWTCFHVNAQAESAKKPVLAIQYWQTSQGTPVYFVRAPELPMIDVQIIFTAGSAYDNQQWGIANLVASLLNEGTKAHNADQIADTFDQAGAQFDSNTNRDVTIIALRSLSDPKYFTPALQMFNEVLSQANFPDDATARVKQQALSAIRETQQNPSAVAADAFYKILYADHPYGHPVLGTAQTIPPITPGQARDFYHRYFVSGNAKIILVGNLDRAAAEKIAEHLMSVLPKGAPAPALAMENHSSANGVHVIEFPSQQSTIVTGQLGIARQNDQYFPLLVGNYLLGQLPLSSLLFEQVRNQRGLAYGVSSSFALMSYRGPFAITLKTRAAETDQALQVTQQTLKQYITQGPTPAQLQLAKQNLINHFPLSLSTNDKITALLIQMALNQWPLDYLDTYRNKVNAVTPAQVQQAFQNLIHPDTMLTVIIGKKNKT